MIPILLGVSGAALYFILTSGSKAIPPSSPRLTGYKSQAHYEQVRALWGAKALSEDFSESDFAVLEDTLESGPKPSQSAVILPFVNARTEAQKRRVIQILLKHRHQRHLQHDIEYVLLGYAFYGSSALIAELTRHSNVEVRAFAHAVLDRSREIHSHNKQKDRHTHSKSH